VRYDGTGTEPSLGRGRTCLHEHACTMLHLHTMLQLHAREANQLRQQLPTLPVAKPVSLIANNRLKER
jgi:hypothetical protein